MKRFILFIFFLSISYICYQQLFAHGFIFEEWQKYAEVQALKSVIPGGFTQYYLGDILLGKGRIVGAIILNTFLLYFGNTAAPYAIAGIVGHALNAFFLYSIAKKLLFRDLPAIAVSLVFLTVPIYREALSYFAATVETVYAVTWYLISLDFMLRYIERKKIIWVLGSILFAYVSLQFKQSAIFSIFIIGGIIGYVHRKTLLHARGWISALFITTIVLIIALYGFSSYSAWYVSLYTSGEFMPVISITNFFLYPLLCITHFLIPERFLVKLGTYYVLSHYPALGWIPPYVYEFIYSSFAVDIISLIIGIVLWVLIGAGVIFAKRKKLGIFLLVLYWMSFLPIAIAQQQRGSGFLESRYYYTVGPAFALLAVYTVNMLLNRVKKKIFVYMVICFSMLFVLKNITLIHRELKDTLVTSASMRRVVDQIRIARQEIPENPIFYMENGQDLFPHFGTGYMMALQYPDSRKIPGSLFLIGYTQSPVYWATGIGKKDYEGYATDNGQGVGFFYKKTSIQKFFRTHSEISPKQVVGFSITENQTIRSMTDDEISEIFQ